MKDVVYISWMPLTEKVERDWYITHLVDNGVNAEYWDVTGLLFPGVKFQESLERNYLTRISCYQQFESLLAAKDVSQTNFLMLLNYEGRFNRFYRLLTNHGCKLYFIEWGNFPIKDRSSLVDRFAKLINNPGKFTNSLVNKLRSAYAKRLKLVKPFDVVFAAGAVSMAMHQRAGRRVAVNLCDYDNYLQSQKKPVIFPDKKYAVFLDINLSFQADIKVIGWDYINAQAYADSLNRFFRMVEERFNVTVVIAAHPKANYSEDYFENRPILKELTPELVKNADFVLSHHSASISFCVLNRKPILFVYSNEMERIYSKTIVPWICDIAEYLGQPVYNVDEVMSAGQIDLTEPDSVRYDLYKYNYLTSKETEGCLNRDIMLAELTA